MTSAVDLMTQHIVDTAIKPQPWLAVGASLCAIGVLMGRKYRTETNLRSNLYVVGIADSGAGKDHARNAVKEAFIAAGLNGYLGGNRIASGAGLLAALQRQPALLFQKDEFGHFLSSIADKRRAPAYKSEIWDLLVELYTSAGGTFLGSEYADQKERPRVDIVQPCCCLYATTVPGPFWTALRQAALFDGGLARLLVFWPVRWRWQSRLRQRSVHHARAIHGRHDTRSRADIHGAGQATDRLPAEHRRFGTGGNSCSTVGEYRQSRFDPGRE
jgi:hypothetical protein